MKLYYFISIYCFFKMDVMSFKDTFSGGVLLEDNPWVCGCGIVWLGSWIRRWMRETLRVQMLHFDGFLYAQNLARRTVCTLPGTNTTIPLVDLDPSEFGCKQGSDNAATAVLIGKFWLTKILALFTALWSYNYYFVENCGITYTAYRTS